MIKSLIYKVLLVIIFITTSSCNKWLDVKPQDGLVRQDFWKTKEQLESAVIGVYVTLVENTVVNQLFKWGELRADLVKIAPSPGKPSVDERAFAEGNILSTNSLADWSNIYRVINNCNLVIDYGPTVRDVDPTLKLEELNNKLAEVRTIRALLYFYLLRTYGEVPLQLQGVSEDTQVVALPKSSEAQIFEQIIADLKFAEENALTDYGNPQFNRGRITKYAVYALEADVYLWMDKYVEANEACDKIISSGKFILEPGIPGQFYQNLYETGNSYETIFAFQYSLERPNPFWGMFIAAAKPFMASASGLENLFPSNPNDPTIQDLRAGGVSYREFDLSVWKYNGLDFEESKPASESIANFIVYRYADVLLMKAEALAWIGGRGQEALDLINQVRVRASALDKSGQVPDLNSSSSVADYVFAERGREFAFEGKRWFDILRYAKRNNYANMETLVSLGTVNIPSNLQQSVSVKLLDKNSHYLPVPFRELQANKKLVQNPFYQ